MKRTECSLQIRKKRVDSGSVFILVLWTLFFLGALALAIATLVFSSINLSTHMKHATTARSLARGAVDFAIVEVMGNATNWEVTAGKEATSDTELFKDNEKLAGGTFSVYYEYVAEDGGVLVTNYGVMDESTKENINSMSVGKMKNVFDEIADIEDLNINSESLSEEIYTSRHLTDASGSSYSTTLGSSYRCSGRNGKGAFELLQELLLLKSFEGNADLFEKMEPYLTVYPKGYYKATAVGKALVDDEAGMESDALAEVRIDFVFNGQSGKIVYWHEY